MFLTKNLDKNKLRPLSKHLCEINHYNRPKGKVLCIFLNFPLVLESDLPIQHKFPSPRPIEIPILPEPSPMELEFSPPSSELPPLKTFSPNFNIHWLYSLLVLPPKAFSC